VSSSPNPTIAHLIREVLPRRLHQIPLEESMSLRGDLGIDSIGLMSLAFRLEEEFHIDLMLSAEEVAKVQTIGDVQRLVHQLAKGSAS
jgi:acyl carrier protein